MHDRITSLVDGFERGRLTRRQLVVGLAAILGGAPALRGAARGDTIVDGTFKATAINHIALSVTDIERSRDFYQKHLSLPVMSLTGWTPPVPRAILGLGESKFLS